MEVLKTCVAVWRVPTPPRACSGEDDLDPQPASGLRLDGERGPVGLGDGAHDRQAKPVPVPAASTVAAGPAEGLEQALDVLR